MKAMIFAAGLGTRLRPLTNDRPKALVEVGGLSLLEIALRRLRGHGVREIIVNVHHFADQVEAYLRGRADDGLSIAVSDERARLLDTGGGLKKATWFFADGAPFFVVNADILTDLDFSAMYRAHLRTGALATLAIRQRPSSRVLLFDDNLSLCGWRNNKTGAERWRLPDTMARPFAFSGVQVLSPSIFGLFPEADVFSTIDVYLSAPPDRLIQGWRHDESFWLDVGKPDALAEAEAWVRKQAI